MQTINMKKLSIIAAMLLTAGLAHAEGTAIDLSGVSAAFIAGVAVITAFIGTVGLSKAGLGVVVWGWRKAVAMVSGR
ncbi:MULTISPECIES: hypothetical protein [Aeromonas]|uniref:Uncharacterized protein n=1 Tax=Aeromonas hydrophila TaxID=644 RepID=A0A8I0BCL9_AERHY|nr:MULTISPECIES: hypothetical protein [Aeromonas]MBC8670706.1 hypothetical protein [Aeromonas hydrophila]MBC8674253.1 hypothetical protein [Aeromonas hydrophila]MBC8686642.1 hypothetical protein [Aeromonas hydrophila]QSR43415.1 hypothetical protein HUI95_10360 [Aeromonas dhakensis]HDX8356426.1 hypothetical protein [Aeromonas hydrophila]